MDPGEEITVEFDLGGTSPFRAVLWVDPETDGGHPAPLVHPVRSTTVWDSRRRLNVRLPIIEPRTHRLALGDETGARSNLVEVEVVGVTAGWSPGEVVAIFEGSIAVPGDGIAGLFQTVDRDGRPLLADLLGEEALDATVESAVTLGLRVGRAMADEYGGLSSADQVQFQAFLANIGLLDILDQLARTSPGPHPEQGRGASKLHPSGPATAPGAPAPRRRFPPERKSQMETRYMGTMDSNVDVVFLSAARTPFGSFGGSLKDRSATDLAVHSAEAAVERSGVDPAEFDHVYYGNVIQTSRDAVYLARHVGLRAGLPDEVPAVTVNRLCGSGFQAVVDGAQQIVMSEAKACLTGGTESMSQAPHVVRGARWGMRLGPAADFEDVLWEALTDTNCGLSMAETAEKLAQQYDVTRQEVDEYALRSHRLAAEAWDEGKFDEEVVPVPVKKRGKETTFERDEDIRTDTSMEALSGLRPYFREDGLVTAGNASGIGDGAASLVVASSDYAEANGLEPMGRIVSWAFAGVDPSIMGIGPAPAIRKALDRAGLTLGDMDVVEVNEAFAPQYVSVEKELGLDREKVNVNGGAIALTHPLGATGARITGHLLYELRRRGGGLAVGSACIGGGQGGAIVVEV